MPYGAKANEIQKAFERVIEPYMQPGNRIADDMYDNLELPWAADPVQTAFPKDKFRRFDWDRGGVLSDGKDFFGGSHEFPIGVYEQALGTVSAVTRPPDLAGTERDCVAEVPRQMRQVLGERAAGGRGDSAVDV
jgi:trans-aconitate 3-methyltransferase